MAASAVNREWLHWVEQLETNARRSSPRGDPERFACLLDVQPGLLVPARHEKAAAFPEVGQLQWNPHCTICPPGEIPVQLERPEEWTSGFAFSESCTAWVHEAQFGQRLPFSLGDELASRCLAAQRSGVRAGQFSPLELEALFRAGLGISRTEAKAAVGQKVTERKEQRARFRERGYSAIKDLVHPFHVGELRRYYRRMIRRERVALGDYQSSLRYVAHNEPVARFFHLQLTRMVGELVGTPVKPSYVYFASYQSGAALKRHTDREQCEFSLTFCLDYAPEPADATPWPLYLHTTEGRVTIHQRLGDALLYRGCKVPHSRNALAAGHTSTSIFFHYVPADFAGPLT